MKISHKLIAGYVLIAVITAATGLVGIFAAAKLKSSYEELALGGVPIHKSLGQLKFAGLRIVTSTIEAVGLMEQKRDALSASQVADSTDSLLDELRLIDSGKSLFYRAIAEYKSVAKIYDPGVDEHIKTIEGLAAELLDASFSLLVAQKTEGEASQEVVDAKAIFKRNESAYLDYLDSIIDVKEARLENKLRTNVIFYGRAFFFIILLGTLSLVVAFTFGILQARGIAVNLAKLTRRAELIGQGDLGQIVELDTRDELGDLAATFNIMSADLQKSYVEKEKSQADLKRHAEKLENNSKELQEIVFAASHDLQEPMRKIMTFSERLIYEHDKGTSDEAVEYLRRMISAAGKMRFLLYDLMEYSKLITSDPRLEAVKVKILLESAVDRLREKFADQEIEFVYPPDLPQIDCDKGLMETVFYNLFENSLKFGGPDGNTKVEISMQSLDGNYQILVKDNGPGFNPKFADRIFSIFEKLHGEGQYEGNGIGLALCRKIMEKHGGKIGVESQEGAGATFIITLPAVPDSE